MREGGGIFDARGFTPCTRGSLIPAIEPSDGNGAGR